MNRTYRINLPDDAVPGSFVDITLKDGGTVIVRTVDITLEDGRNVTFEIPESKPPLKELETNNFTPENPIIERLPIAQPLEITIRSTESKSIIANSDTNGV